MSQKQEISRMVAGHHIYHVLEREFCGVMKNTSPRLNVVNQRKRFKK